MGSALMMSLIVLFGVAASLMVMAVAGGPADLGLLEKCERISTWLKEWWFVLVGVAIILVPFVLPVYFLWEYKYALFAFIVSVNIAGSGEELKRSWTNVDPLWFFGQVFFFWPLILTGFFLATVFEAKYYFLRNAEEAD
ncbi:MAG: hypothetical protein A2Z52_00530 [Candidatus Moranbacteria bacterium RBG_19FT_COMBO_42_6]|nr:MAG: hypothetical protein A2Z52_00530 [Candidatus Moranbacteria bacterium RBG_19FT_COMBO_42_6]